MSIVGEELSNKELSVTRALREPGVQVKSVETSGEQLDDGQYGFEAELYNIEEGTTQEAFGKVSSLGAVTETYDRF